MAREHNYLLGQGERLAHRVKVAKGGNAKNPPYDFATAKARISQRLEATDAAIAKLPEDACPRGEAVALVTLHPRFLSKSDFPSDLFSSVGLRTVGSRSRPVIPEKWGVEKHGETAITEELFVAGTKTAFHRWASTLKGWRADTPGADKLSHIEDLAAFEAKSKLRTIPVDEQAMLEVVLHNSGGDDVVLAFIRYAQALGAEPLITKRQNVRGLTFMPVRVDPRHAEDLARFSFVRVARGMPTLRPFRPAVLRGSSSFAVTLPAAVAMDSTTRAAIFDGGIPESARGALEPWVTLIEPTGIGKSTPSLEYHGLGVTAAFLFGPLQPGKPPQTPLCHVDHIRVLDDKTGANSDVAYYDVLERIDAHLSKNLGLYSFVNISLGPPLAVDDEEVTLWTAALDKRFAHGECVATVAAGNDGELDAAARLNRIQPPADGVNVLSVGSADRAADGWQRAGYSCVGPGRCPGLVKPDGVAFGGSEDEPFGILTAQLRGNVDAGTSFAAPFALRSATSVRVQLGQRLKPLAIRGLLIQRAETLTGHDWQEVGWGRFEADPLRLITCDDDEALVVFQGELPVGEHLRAPIPMPPANNLVGDIIVSATLVIAPDVDPEHPGAYTRSGLEVSFRPHNKKYSRGKDGKKPQHAKTRPFFSGSLLYGQSETVLREDGHKWEPCLRNQQTMRASSLSEPCFDIYYHHRESGMKANDPQPIPYALIVGVKAVKVPDFYNRVVRTYANVLLPIQPQTRIQVRS